jgi:hypothetical protein
MATDGAGNLHLVLVGRLEEKTKALHVLHLVWNGAAWSTPESIKSYEDFVPEWPRLAIGKGNRLYVVWFTRTKQTAFASESADARYNIWYAHKQIDAPTINPTVLPTPTVVATVPPTQAVGAGVATATPFPTPRPALSPSERRIGIYKESDYLLLAGLSLLPAAVLVGVIVAVRARRRQS